MINMVRRLRNNYGIKLINPKKVNYAKNRKGTSIYPDNTIVNL